MKIYLTDGTEFTERTTTMAIDPPKTDFLTTIRSLSLEGLNARIKETEDIAAELPTLHAERSERIKAMFPGQKLVKARKAKGTP